MSLPRGGRHTCFIDYSASLPLMVFEKIMGPRRGRPMCLPWSGRAPLGQTHRSAPTWAHYFFKDHKRQRG